MSLKQSKSRQKFAQIKKKHVHLRHQIIVELKNIVMNNIDSNIGEIVMYQPDETIRLEVKTGNHMFTTKKCSKCLDNTKICSTFAVS